MRTAKWVTRSAGAAMAVFHVWLLAHQAASGRLTADPALLVRWALALLLAAGLWRLSRTAGALLSRRGVVVWLLAALLHAPAVGARFGQHDLPQLPPEAIAAALQTAVLAAAGVVAVAAVGGLARRRTRTGDPRPALWWLVAAFLPAIGLHDRHALVQSPRPPPFAR